MYYDFKKDLQDGQQAELEFIELLKIRGYIILEHNRDWKYDVAFAAPVNGMWRTWHAEVKADYENEKTGNVAIEFESRGIISGISVTLADRWYHRLADGFWEIKTQTLKELIRQKKYLFISDNGGDHNSKTRCYIFAGDVFKKFSKRFE